MDIGLPKLADRVNVLRSSKEKLRKAPSTPKINKKTKRKIE